LEVPLETVKKAAELMISFIEHSKVAFDLMGADETLQSARTVWRWIKRNQQEQFTQRDCFNALRAAFSRMDLLKSALQILEERNYVQILEAEKNGVGRKPSPLVLVNPDALKEDL
jgi:putative DNA primase/helicase